MEPQMIIRANLGAPDLLLDGSSPLQDSLGKPLICKTNFYLSVIECIKMQNTNNAQILNH